MVIACNGIGSHDIDARGVAAASVGVAGAYGSVSGAATRLPQLMQ